MDKLNQSSKDWCQAEAKTHKQFILFGDNDKQFFKRKMLLQNGIRARGTINWCFFFTWPNPANDYHTYNVH